MISALGSVVGLIGIAIIYFKAGTLNLADLSTLSGNWLTPGMAAFAMLVIGFGVKAEAFPVNGWVPEVYGAVGKASPHCSPGWHPNWRSWSSCAS